ncbi:MAG: FixH family protein [Alphaproteobacteria bacterium]
MRTPLTGRRVLALLVGFFGAVTAVNAVMIWLALDSFPGVSSPNAFREGLDWNRHLAAKDEQIGLGWQVDVDLRGEGARRTVVARFRDGAGAGLSGMEVTARLIRPVAQGHDATVSLAERVPGEYAAEVETPLTGHWRLTVEAVQAGEPVWRMERDLWLK